MGAVALTSGGGVSGALRWRLGLGVGGGGGVGCGLGGAVLRVCGRLLARVRVVGATGGPPGECARARKIRSSAYIFVLRRLCWI
jgi:hypothetical protein